MQIFGPPKFLILKIQPKTSKKRSFIKDCCSNVQKPNSMIFGPKLPNDMDINLNGSF